MVEFNTACFKLIIILAEKSHKVHGNLNKSID